MENNRVMQRSSSFWFRLATILTAVVLGLLSASAVQAALIIGQSGSWLVLSGTQAQFWIGNGTTAWFELGFPPPSMAGATTGYLIMVTIIPVIVAAGIVLLSFRFLKGKGWLALLQVLVVGLLAFWLVRVLLMVIFPY